METKHTAGPWKYEDWKYSLVTPKRIVPSVVSETKQMLVCQMNSDEGNANPYIIQLEEARANARLIAAAPELLEVLIKIKEYLKTGEKISNHSMALYDIETAINKATQED